jgi:signal transduction histidine kinase
MMPTRKAIDIPTGTKYVQPTTRSVDPERTAVSSTIAPPRRRAPEPAPEEGRSPDLPRPGADMRSRVDRIAAWVAVLARTGALALVVPSVAAGIQLHAYTDVPLAATVYTAVAGYSALLIVSTVYLASVPAWMLAADLATAGVALIVFPAAVTERFLEEAPTPDLEPLMVTVGVTIALITASPLWTAVASTMLAGCYGTGLGLRVHGGTVAASIAAPFLWTAATAGCCCAFIHVLRSTVQAVDVANRQLLRQRERLAADHADTEARRRHFLEQLRRHRALHDGPLRLLTAIAGPGPLAHPDEHTRRQCVIATNVLRGTTPDDPYQSLTELSLALIKAGGESASAGLRVQYHFAGLPDDLPDDVVRAFAAAGAEALSNVVTHSGISRARVTAVGEEPAPGPASAGEQPAVTVIVSVVDQGKGFDPEATEPGYGTRHSIIGRMREVGGDATVDSHLGEGTRVDLRWPA